MHLTNHNFTPAWWLPGGHLQTLWAAIHSPKLKYDLQAERIELPDGDFIDLQYYDCNEMKPLVILMHGLEGSSKSAYMRRMINALAAIDYGVIAMHFRGCSGEQNRLVRTYHAGDTADFDYVIKLLRQRFPNRKLMAIGYSLGGNVLLKWLARSNNKEHLDSAVAVSVPFLLDQAVKRLNHGFSKFYQWLFIKTLRNKIICKSQTVPIPLDLNALSTIKNLRDFDDKITAPLHGFIDAKDYYIQASSRPLLKNITVNTLLLHAKDDPFLFNYAIPTHADLSSQVSLEVLPKGGHIGFVSGILPGRAKYWLETRILQFFTND